jgi:uracil phosphoribosyltransferase
MKFCGLIGISFRIIVSDLDPNNEKNNPDLNPNIYFRETKTLEFQQVADRLMRLLGEEALCRLPTVVEGQVDTPCGICTGEKKKNHVVLLSILSPTSDLLPFVIIHFATGPVDTEGEGRPICVVSIVRSGDILQEAVSFRRFADPVFFLTVAGSKFHK